MQISKELQASYERESELEGSLKELLHEILIRLEGGPSSVYALRLAIDRACAVLMRKRAS